MDRTAPLPNDGSTVTMTKRSEESVPWHRVADVVERVAAFAGDVPTLLAMRLVSHLWLGAVRRRAADAHNVTGAFERRMMQDERRAFEERGRMRQNKLRIACGCRRGVVAFLFFSRRRVRLAQNRHRHEEHPLAPRRVVREFEKGHVAGDLWPSVPFERVLEHAVEKTACVACRLSSYAHRWRPAPPRHVRR